VNVGVGGDEQRFKLKEAKVASKESARRDVGIPVAYMRIMDAMESAGIREIQKLPGAAVLEVDKNWTVAGHCKEKSIEVDPGRGGMKMTLDPFDFAVWWNGWVAGVVGPIGGIVVGHPSSEGANEDTLIAALEKFVTDRGVELTDVEEANEINVEIRNSIADLEDRG